MLVEKGLLHGTSMNRRPPGVASDFNALVTPSIILSVAMWARGSRRKGAD
jgi:hypothetical protein